MLDGEDFKPSDNDYDWLGPGIYFWESNWARGLEFASEQMKRKESKIRLSLELSSIWALASI